VALTQNTTTTKHMPNWHEWTEQANPRPEARIKVCHKQIACYGPFAAQLKNEFLPFLQRNPGEVITLFLETYVGREHLQQVFNTLPELDDVSFDPAHFAADQWPAINQMAARKGSGQKITVLSDQDWIVQN
jgi:hypothetical protein